MCHPINQTLSQCKIAEKLLWRHKSHWAVQLQHRLLRLASPPATGLLQQTNQLYLSSAPGPCWLSVPPIFTLKWSYCVCVCVCIRVVRKDNKLTKTHPVPNPTTNLHYQDRGIHTLIDIQMLASDSHQRDSHSCPSHCLSQKYELPEHKGAACPLVWWVVCEICPHLFVHV